MVKYKVMYGLLWIMFLILWMITGNDRCILLILVLTLLDVVLKFLSVQSIKGMKVTCSMQEDCQLGQKSQLHIKIQRTSSLPIGQICFRLQSENILFQETREQEITLEVAKARELDFELQIENDQCGKIYYTADDFRCYDFLLLNVRQLRSKQLFQSVVYPATAHLKVQIRHHSMARILGESYEENKKGNDNNELFAIREYQEEDSPKSIHWKLTSKMDKLMVREFSQPSNFQTCILVDAAFFNHGQAVDKEQINDVYSMTYAVSDALIHQDLGHHIGFLLNDRIQYDSVSMPDQLWNTVEEMMSMQVCLNTEDTIGALLSSDLFANFTKVILITGAVEETDITMLSQRVDLTVMVSSDGESYMENQEGIHYVTIAHDSLCDVENYILI